MGRCRTRKERTVAAAREPAGARVATAVPVVRAVDRAVFVPRPASIAVNASTAAHLPRMTISPPRLCARSLNDSAVLTVYRNKLLRRAGKTVSHLSIIVILALHREHFPARGEFTKINLPLTRLTATRGTLGSVTNSAPKAPYEVPLS